MAPILIPSSSSSSSTPLIKYDVFLSFRGDDTRYNFTSHLHKAFRDKKIQTFMDDKLNRGYEISPSLLEAIENSQISVIIFSRDYASSKWCLEELVKILECRKKNNQVVIPVFYGVDPSNVRHQTGSFAKAFTDHEHRFKESLDKVQKWKDALNKAANLSGWHSSTNKLESVLVEDIVNDVSKRLNDLSSNDTTGFVGIDSKVKEIESLLCIGTYGVRSVGIWGSGGIGKTTLAGAVFNKISHQFEGSYFVDNIRVRSEQRGGLNHLGRELVSTILGDENGNIGTSVGGHNFTRNRLGRKNILICFDDVNDFSQIRILIESLYNSLGSRSRVIITARDRQLLKICRVNHIYEVQKLLYFHALELFCCSAFKQNHPPADFVELSQRVVTHAGGIPLALKVLGSFLLDRPKKVWESAIIKLERVPDKDIQKVLKISYDELNDEEQMIFLDIACFLKGRDIDFVKQFLDVSGFCTEIGISVLIDKSLITISNNTITMHDLLQALGREIVRQEAIHDPNKRTRVWQQEDVYHVLNENKALEFVVGISFDMTKIRNVHLKFDVLAKMRKLRFLEFHRSSYALTVFRGLESVFIKLRHLQWHAYPSKSFQSYFQLTNLGYLFLTNDNITELPEFPDGCLSSLREFDLCGNSLESIPASIINLSNLDCLYISNCRRLKCLPKLQLGVIGAYGCTSLEELPGFSFRQQNYIRADFANCFKLDQNIFEDIVEDALLNIKQVDAELYYPGNEIPKWFNFRSMGYFINVELPPDWLYNNFLGFAICIVVVPDHQVDFESESMCKINLTSKDGHESVWGTHLVSTFVYSNHVFVKSPILPFDLQTLLCYENEVTFEFCLHSSSLKIEKCGVHLMFGEKVDGSSWVGEDEDVLSFANVHDNCEEVNEPQKIDGDTQLIKMVKALCVLSLGLQVYLKEVFLLDSVGYLNVNCLDLAWWTCPRRF